MRRYRSRARRGVLLLVILGLLAMFALVAVAFVVVSAHAMRSAKAIQRIGQQDVRPRETLHQGLLQALRGTANPASRMGPHSLLEDIYGNDTVGGTVQAGSGVGICGGQIIEFTSNIADPQRRVGCVLTMIDGPAAGRSTRILDYIPNTNKFQVLAFDDVATSAVLAHVNNQACRFVINGTPFSGTGFGFDASTGKLNGTVPLGGSNFELGLLPGHPQNANPLGGANEDYDAVGFQNVLLGAQIVDGTGQVFTIPSLHRPALVNYWQNHPTANWASNVDLQRAVMLRPLPGDHPDFDGSNPNFNPAWDGVTPGEGSWDVDNDGDARPDSIWVDLGMPVRSTVDGRLYKPLFALLCLDMDGRLNLNAHGCPAQADPADADSDGTPDYYDDATLTGNYRFAGGTPTAPLPRGQGYGPAEINLTPLFGSTSPPNVQATQRYQSLMVGNGTIGGRYGETSGAAGPGVSGFDDLLSQNVGYEFWNGSAYYTSPPGWSYWGFGAFGGSPAGYRANAYGTPPDLNANGYLGLDAAGRPLYWQFAEPNEQRDDPYELDLSRQRARGLTGLAPIDNAFGVGELERLLRPFDRDAPRLPNRLAALTFDNPPGRSILHDRRHAITTESWDLPCPAVALPEKLRDELRNQGLPRPGHVTDLLRAENVPEAVWKDLLPPEVLAGQRMNLNRPLGDGQDNNPQNGVVDEPGEAQAMLDKFQQVGAAGTLLPPIDFDHVNGIDVNKDGNVDNFDRALARQLHARHLYVLLLLLADTEYLEKELKTDEEVVRFLAQWAVNAVDFRDRDSIMTRFHFDPDPFDGGGWNPPPLDPRFVVFGCERPELLISETLAFHDRRTEDLEDPENRTDHDPQDEADNDFDQKKRPRGALFVELYNPWTRMEPPPGEFCFDSSANALTRGVRLNQTTAAGGHPVWRLIVVEPEDDQDIAGEQVDPDDPMDAERPRIERSVYFVDLSSGGFDDPDDGQAYYTDMPAEFAPVEPGRYAVVGPGEAGAAGPEYPTPIGDRTDGRPATEARRIVLTPDTNPDTMQVGVFENNNGSSTDLPLNEIMPATAVVINRPRRLSISEPTDGYPINGPGGQPYDQATGEYDTAFDEPLDADSDLADALLTTGTTAGVRVVHLQRLADPLMPWDRNTNPYRTIDSMPVDLTAFNGVTSDPDPNDADEDVMFDTRQRGETEQKAALGMNNVWKQEPVTKEVVAGSEPPIPNHYFDDLLVHTLGFLNKPFEPRSNVGPIYRGDPGIPFPWLTWNNRPYVSQLELMMVPVLRSSKLLVRNEQDENAYYRFVKKPLVDPQPYDAPNTPATNVAFPHLMNFFQSTRSDTSGNSPQLHRLLEYVHVPSRFVGTQLQGNPAAFAAPPANHSFRPPFNRISRYREPGRINLNTIFDERVFRGLMNEFPGMNWTKFVQSRQGYAGANMLSPDARFPTRFVRPFRSFAGGQMVPLPTMELAREVDATLLRSDGLEPSDTTSQRPLFHHESLQAYNNTDRNPYFRYQGLQRLGNLVTTRSNVYAIWVTVGYFEVEQVPYDSDRYPDGFKLAGELGIETGEVRRHRAFYIIDRSIPVGFSRGQDYNVEDGILVKRFIE